MKDRREKMVEYELNYGHIPHDYAERLEYLYDLLNLNDNLSDKILETRQNFINSTYYEVIRIILYEIPEHTPRPRARLINRRGVLNAIGSNSFIRIYSVTGQANHEFMKLYKQEHLSHLEQLLCTPCDIEFRAYFPTPKYYNKIQTFMAEMGLDRPLIKPDFDNIEKAYSDAFNGNIWLDDIIVVDATFRKFYSILPRMEIDLKYANQVYNYHQYNAITSRKDFTPEMTLNYFGGK